MVDMISSSSVLNTSTSARVGNVQGDVLAVRGNQGQARTGEEKRVFEDRKMTEEEAIKLIEKANKEFIVYDRKFEFSIHEATKQIMVKIIDVNTDEVIREIPPEKILDIVASIWEVAGIIVDRKI